MDGASPASKPGAEMAKGKFLEYIGGAWLNGKSVAVYAVDGGYQLRAETTGGKIIARVKNLTGAEYESAREGFFDGGLRRGDVVVCERALRYLGVTI